ncbi:MAG: hypothetical protein L6Q77_12930 [Bacteroidetes bacterium]|nr:hypothetical protein [Bacteroidota bacterium]
MIPQEIELKKVRNFSETLNTTLSLIRHLFKPLMLSQFAIAFPVLLIGSVIHTFFVLSMLDPILLGNPENIAGTVKATLLSSLLTLPGVFLMWALAMAAVKVYEQKQSAEISVREIWDEGKTKLLPFAGIWFLSLLIFISGLFLLIIPGLFFGIRIVIGAPLAAIGDGSIWKSIEKSWDYTKGKWWTTFGLILVLYLLSALIGFVAGIPVVILTMVQGITQIQTGAIGTDFPKLILYVSMFFNPLLTLTYVITIIGLTVHAYSLQEEQEATGLQEKIAAISDPESNG